MRTEAEIRTTGMQALIAALGLVEGQRSIQRILPPRRSGALAAMALPAPLPATHTPLKTTMSPAHAPVLLPLPLGEGRGEGCRSDLRQAAHQAKSASSPLNTIGRCYQK